MATIEAQTRESAPPRSLPGWFTAVVVWLLGMGLGVVFVKSGVARWQRVHDMFLFRQAYMFTIIGTGIVVAMIAMQIIKSFGIRNLAGAPIEYHPKPFHAGIVWGGLMFGVGWALTGACPGPIYAQIGAGEWRALFSLAGALLGTLTYAWFQPRLP